MLVINFSSFVVSILFVDFRDLSILTKSRINCSYLYIYITNLLYYTPSPGARILAVSMGISMYTPRYSYQCHAILAAQQHDKTN